MAASERELNVVAMNNLTSTLTPFFAASRAGF
jgi:hypothetical protein